MTIYLCSTTQNKTQGIRLKMTMITTKKNQRESVQIYPLSSKMKQLILLFCFIR